MRGTHDSSLAEEVISHFAAEAKGKVAPKQAHLVLYEKIKGYLPAQIKVSPIAEIPHKSKAFRSILDLSFSLKPTPHGRVTSVKENIKKTAPGGAIDHIGYVLLRSIHAFSEAPECANIFQSKWNIKDGFWRLDCKEGDEWNFCYVWP